MEANIIVGHMSEAESNWHLQNSRDIAVRDYNTGLSNAKKRGLEEGLKKGRKEGAQQKAIEAAVNLLKMKLGTVEQIAKAQGLPVEKVLELKAQLGDKI